MTGHDPQPGGAGPPHERTGLAWQRTMLSGLACGLVVARLVAEVSLPLAAATAVLALVTTSAFGFLALRRFRRTATALAHRDPVGDGRPPALASLLLVVTGLGATAYVLLV